MSGPALALSTGQNQRLQLVGPPCSCLWQSSLQPALKLGALQLLRNEDLKLGSIRFFVIDECDKVLDKAGKPPPACVHNPT